MSDNESYGPVKLIVLQPTTFCNIDCSYCYLPERRVNRKLSIGNTILALKNIRNQFVLSDSLKILWHSGEPLVLGPRYFLDCIEKIIPAFSENSITFEFQTNATLLSKDWRSLYTRPDVRFGVSLDGPEELHNRCRRYRNGLGSFEAAMSGIRTLLEEGVEFTAICVINEDALSQPDLYEDFFLSTGILNVSFNIPNREGVNKIGFSDTADTNEKLREFYRHFVRRRIRENAPVRIFQIDDMIRKMLKKKLFVSYDEHYAFKIITINADGSMSTFSPELAGFSCDKLGSFATGSAFPSFYVDAARTDLIQHEIECGVGACRETCEYFEVCGGGIPSTKFFDTQSFRSSHHLSCNLAVKALADVVAEELLLLPEFNNPLSFLE